MSGFGSLPRAFVIIMLGICALSFTNNAVAAPKRSRSSSAAAARKTSRLALAAAKTAGKEARAAKREATAAKKEARAAKLRAGSIEKQIKRVNRYLFSIRRSVARPTGWLQQVDEALNASLAATLAGITLLAAVMLLGFTGTWRQRYDEMLQQSQYATPSVELIAALKGSKACVGKLTTAFYAFVVLLAETIVLDPLDGPGAMLADTFYAKGFDLIIPVGCLAFGLYCLFSVALTLVGMLRGLNIDRNT